MIEPWFDPSTYAWIPGTVFGSVAGLMGGLIGWLAPQGRGRRFVMRTWSTLLGAAVVMLGLGLYALATKQPYGIWYGFLLPGVVGTTVVGFNFITIIRTYRKVEERKLAAKDLL